MLEINDIRRKILADSSSGVQSDCPKPGAIHFTDASRLTVWCAYGIESVCSTCTLCESVDARGTPEHTLDIQKYQ